MPIPEISPQALQSLLAAPRDQRPTLLDVRSPGENALVALPDSVLIPLGELHEHPDELEALRGKKVVVYCHHGVRSLNGAHYLLSLGIDACSLAGGIDLWSRAVDPSLPRY